MKRYLFVFALTLVLAAPVAALASAGDNQSAQRAELAGGSFDQTDQIIPGQYIVVLKQDPKRNGGPRSAAANISRAMDLAASVGATTQQVYGTALTGFSANLTDGQVEQLRADPAVDFVEQDRMVSLVAQVTPWGIDRVTAPPAHAGGHTGAGVKVGVIDTGIDYLHPDLAANYVGGHDFYFNDTDPMDDHGHGTHVSGTIAGIDNTIGVLGVAPAASLYGIKVFGPGGSSPWSIIVAGVNWAMNNGMDVVNMSLGGGFPSAAMEVACNNAYASGMVLVAAAGNTGGAVQYPARYASVIAVSAIDVNNNIAWFSSRGAQLEVTSPGVNVYSCYLTSLGSYRYWQGTSMACPHTVGVVALIIGTGNFLTPLDVRTQLTATAVDIGLPGHDNLFGYGIPDAAAAVGSPIPRPPTAEFGATPLGGCAPLNVSFTDQSGGLPTSWLWDFGDGATSTLQNPSHAYAADGSYSVSLTATNDLGSDQITKVDLLTVGGPMCQAPIANFAATPTTGCAPLAVTFYDLSTGAASWLWDFGDGATSIVKNPIHTYAAGGSYSVTLTVTNVHGSDQMVKAGYVNVSHLPTVDFSGTPLTGSPPLTVNFTDLTTPNPTSWFWDFGDFGTSNLQNPTVVFDKPGEYKVILTAWNACGSGEMIKEAYVNVQEGGCNTPVAAFSGTPLSGTTPLTVSFTDQSTNAPFAWSWDFGDLTQSNLQNPSHTYSAAGTYTVTLTAGNACGENTATQTGYITVSDPTCTNPPVAGFAGAPTAGDVPLTVNFTDQSTNGPTGWAWDFGDGGTSAVQNPAHVYTMAGIYTVSLTASNACGSDLVTQTNYITVTEPGCALPPVAGFAGAPTSGFAPLTVDFTDQSTNVPTGWSWDFGDGGTSAVQNPSHVYATAGVYTVSLTASNACGSHQVVQTNYITVTDPPSCTGPPVADFMGSPQQGSPPLTVMFTDLSTNDPTSWSWEFGDDGSSTAQNPVHTYTKPGDYKVLLVASNACGSHEVKKEKYIIVPEAPEGAGAEFVTPTTFGLAQNYPNPFNAGTEILFNLAEPAFVRLDIYGITGRKVATLVEGHRAPGSHVVEWNAANQPSGMYLYRLTAGELSETRRMILLK